MDIKPLTLYLEALVRNSKAIIIGCVLLVVGGGAAGIVWKCGTGPSKPATAHAEEYPELKWLKRAAGYAREIPDEKTRNSELFIVAIGYLDAGREAEAMALHVPLMPKMEGMFEAWRIMSRFRGKPDAMLPALEKITDADARERAYGWLNARFIEQGDVVHALEVTKKMSRPYSQSACYERVAQVLVQQGKLAEAEALLPSLSDEGMRNSLRDLLIIARLMEANSGDLRKEALQRGIPEDRVDRALLEFAKTRVKEKQWIIARAVVDNVASANQRATGLIGIAAALVDNQRAPEALAMLREIEPLMDKSDPFYELWLGQLANIRIFAGEEWEVITMIEAAPKERRAVMATHYLHALVKAGQADKAVEVCLADEDRGLLLYALAPLLARAGAIEPIEKLIEGCSNPSEKATICNMVFTALLNKRQGKALEIQ